jgi:hypothetical protein
MSTAWSDCKRVSVFWGALAKLNCRTFFWGGLISFLYTYSAISFAECTSERAVIFVPGTLNSAVPGGPSSNPYDRLYFSKAMFDTAEKYSCHIYVVKGLTWFGDFKSNGQIVYNEINEWLIRQPHLKAIPLDIIAHSAGGFYALEAASLNAINGSPLKFGRLNFLSTPMQGLELANVLTSNRMIRRQMEAIFNRQYKTLGMDLRGLWQLRSEQVNEFLTSHQIANDLEIHTYAGIQAIPEKIENSFDSPFLPPVFQAFEFIIDRISDGIVSFESAMGKAEIKGLNDNSAVHINVHPEALIPLDHVEQVLDYSYLKMAGFQKTDHVEREQIKFIELVLARDTDQ